MSLRFPSIIRLHFPCSLLLDLLSIVVTLWRQENYETLLDLVYLLCLPFLQFYFLLTKPSSLNLPALASIALNMAFLCSQEVCLHFLMLLGFAYFNILTLIPSHLLIYMQHGKKCIEHNKFRKKLVMNGRTHKLSDTVTTSAALRS